MNSFVGFANLDKDISKDKYILEKMSLKLKKGLDKEDFFIKDHMVLASRMLGEKENELKNPISIMHEGITYTIILNGKVYNKKEIKNDLIQIGCEFVGDSDEEILLKAFIYFGEEIFSKINGVFGFAIWNNEKEELYLVRDHFGIKPLYYTFINNTVIFSSEIKAIVEHPEVDISIDEIGIAEMFGLRSCTYTRNVCI